ncbi:MAG: hypothetical protein AB7D03_03680 [Thiomicrospira sp.]
MCRFINITDQAMNVALDHKLFQARVAMRQMMREGYEVLAVNVNPERPVLRISAPLQPTSLLIEGHSYNPDTEQHYFTAKLYQCKAHIADVVWIDKEAPKWA